MNLFILCVLTANIASAVLAVWVFGILSQGIWIAPDSRNLLEFWIASVILVLTLVAWVVLFREMHKGGKNAPIYKRD